MFIDSAKISIKAGDGGNGAVAFRREKYINAGGPNGGDGGKGGDIIFVADEGCHTLADFRYKRKYLAENGANGGGNNKSGKYGKNCIIKVPVGTVIRDSNTGRLLADIIRHDQREVICEGGKGGRGNQHFANASRQIPVFAKIGGLGEGYDIDLELKIMADVGLIGFPNVGKSTILSIVSQARPAIGNYHFTTLRPNPGVVSLGLEQNFVLADIPGLIEGASEGAGLGHSFLKHIERTRMMIHVVDISGSEGRNPISDFDIINSELAGYSTKLSVKPQIVAANKADISDEYIGEFTKHVQEKGYEVFIISAAANEGIKELMAYTYKKLQELPADNNSLTEETEAEVIYEVTEEDPFEITVEDGVYCVSGRWVRGLVGSVNFDNHESLRHFQRMIKQKGVVEGLIKAGIQEGDTVRMFDFEFDFIF